MQIRRCEINDLDRISILFDEYRQRYKQASDLESVRGYLRQRLEQQDAIIYIVESDNVFHGFSLLYPSFSSIGLSAIWLLNDFYLASGENKRGMAQALLERIAHDCQEAGAIRIEVSTVKENHRLHKLYRDNGFEKDYKYDYYYLPLNKQKVRDIYK